MFKSSARIATQLLKPSSESLCLMCCKCKKDCCTCVFNETINCEKCLRVARTSFSTLPVHSERYRPSGMLIHRQNSYAHHSKQRTGHREAQSRGPSPHSKNIPCSAPMYM
jgi:hypothetical protein